MPTFDLLKEPWLTCTMLDGSVERFGIESVLRDAHNIMGIAEPSPLDTFAAYRFLIAIVHWLDPIQTVQDWRKRWDGGEFPAKLLADLQDRGRQRFDLFHSDRPFYQDTTAASEGERPVADLRDELPSGTNVAHFRHTRDGVDGLCAGCCALGLIRLSAFAAAGKHGKEQQKPAGINGATPMYALPLGDTLFHTLVMNLHPSSMPVKRGDEPGWLTDAQPGVANIGCRSAFTWRPRRVWLERPQDNAPNGQCACCGRNEKLVKRIAFLPGWNRPFAKGTWPDDPHLLTHIESPQRGRSSTRGKPKTSVLSFHNPSLSVDVQARTWRRVYRAILQSLFVREEARSAQHQHLRRCLEPTGHPVADALAVFGPAANKALYQDGTCLHWRLPRAGIQPDKAQKATVELDWLDHVVPPSIVLAALRRKATERPDVTACLTMIAVQAEAQTRKRFERLVEQLATGCPDAVAEWRRDAEVALEDRLDRACAAIAPRSPLRRREQRSAVRDAMQLCIDKTQPQGTPLREDAEQPAMDDN
ncbi:MAG TPA: type I-E CRISPR-associated protein Cse1/CasA [Planctomycetota bacterium]|nr:type I-E CRISPR-associated protein Cse1/CasA [Planctomycetota bacterium]